MDRPNVIYILGDDHRAEYLSSAGHPIVKTPNIDKLAENGVRFSNAFCTSPACTPSRCCHYLGQWERKHGVNFNSGSSIAPSAWDKSLPMLLKKEGYFLGWVGKNHVPAGEGGYKSGYFEEIFDYWYGNHGHSGFYPKEQAGGGEIYNNAKLDTQVEVFAEGALNFLAPQKDFIENAVHPLPERPKDKPFCLCVTFNLPHGCGTSNMQLRPEDDELYKSAYRDKYNEMPVPKTYKPWQQVTEPRIPKNVYNGLYISQYDYVKNLNTLRERQVRTCQTVTGVDRFVGDLIEVLKKLDLDKNTIIVFSTDHGLHHGEHGLGGKCFLYEEDIRIPMIVCDPRQPEEYKGQVVDEFALAPDLAPTVLDLCGIEKPETMQGSSLVPLIKNENISWRDEFLTEQLMDIQNYPRSESIRTKEWKYIRYMKRTENPAQEKLKFRGTLDNYIECLSSTVNGETAIYVELFNLTDDPYEEHNLALTNEYNSVLDDLNNRLDKHIKAKLPSGNIPLTLSTN